MEEQLARKLPNSDGDTRTTFRESRAFDINRCIDALPRDGGEMVWQGS
jgi:hypothetical protein